MKVSLPTASYTAATPAPLVSAFTPAHQLVAPGDEHVPAAVLARELGFRFAADDADHARAERPGPLAQDQSDAAGGGVHQDRVAALHPVGAAHEELRGEALEHQRRGLLVRDARGHLDEPLGAHVAQLAVGARCGYTYATRSPTRKPRTPRPSAVMTPAASRPRPLGSVTGYRPVRS